MSSCCATAAPEEPLGLPSSLSTYVKYLAVNKESAFFSQSRFRTVRGSGKIPADEAWRGLYPSRFDSDQAHVRPRPMKSKQLAI